MLWVGLGNPGQGYAGNRHNVGFMAIDQIVRDYSFSDWKVSASSAVCEGRIGPTKIRALKPFSFMNKSGLPVANLVQYYNLHPEQITVFHDEIDLGEGRCRVKQGGGHGGHNGLRDIERHLGKEYWRVRIGVGRPKHKEDVHKWVLQNFTTADHVDWLDMLLAAISDEAERLAAGDPHGFASRVAYLAPAPQNNERPDEAETNKN
jgi:PTH1 family peptidyl-tRNA hydrolase